MLALVPVGLWMLARGEANLWDTLTNSLYAIQKATGFTVLLLISLTGSTPFSRTVIKRLKTPDRSSPILVAFKGQVT